MPTWKRIFLKAAGFGAGFGAASVLLTGWAVWYFNRPTPPKQWDKATIAAKFYDVGLTREDNHIELIYTLENTGSTDYHIESEDPPPLIMRSIKQDTLFETEKPFTKYNTPLFIPAKHTVLLIVHLAAAFHGNLPDPATREQEDEYRKQVKEFLTNKMPLLNGFTLFDNTNKYEITFPAGWRSSKK